MSLPGKFITIMAYRNRCHDAGLRCSRIAEFSNPHVQYAGIPIGVPMGTDRNCMEGCVDNPDCDADSVGTLIGTAPVVAGFRPSKRLDAGESLRSGAALVRPSGVGSRINRMAIWWRTPRAESTGVPEPRVPAPASPLWSPTGTSCSTTRTERRAGPPVRLGTQGRS